MVVKSPNGFISLENVNSRYNLYVDKMILLGFARLRISAVQLACFGASLRQFGIGCRAL